MFLFPFASVFPQTGIDAFQTDVESDCEANLENIFKVYDFKKKFDIVDDIYKKSRLKESILFSNYNYDHLDYLFELIRGFPYFEQPKDSIFTVKHGESTEIEYMTEEEVNKYIEQLNCTPEEVTKEYEEFVRDIQF